MMYSFVIIIILIILTKLFYMDGIWISSVSMGIRLCGEGVDSRQGQTHVLNLQSGCGAHPAKGP